MGGSQIRIQLAAVSGSSGPGDRVDAGALAAAQLHVLPRGRALVFPPLAMCTATHDARLAVLGGRRWERRRRVVSVRRCREDRLHALAQLPILDLMDSATPIRISLESPAEVDDIEVKTSDGGPWWIQARQQVGLARGREKPLGSAFDQFVRQYLRSPAPDRRRIGSCSHTARHRARWPRFVPWCTDAGPRP